jgi:hypothetical protein
MTRTTLPALAAVALILGAGTAASPANAGRCDDDWGCGSNGTQTTGIALSAVPVGALKAAGCPTWMCGSNGTHTTGRTPISAERLPFVEAVVLPSGELVELR